MRKIQIWTIQLSQWREAEKQGIKLIDSTVKSGHKGLAPTWDMLTRYRAKVIDEVEYTRLYLLRMQGSQQQLPKLWSSFIKYDRMAIACYCTPGKFCHRHLLLNVVKEFLEVQGVEVELMGEMKKES